MYIPSAASKALHYQAGFFETTANMRNRCQYK